MTITQLLYISPEFPPNFQNFIRRLGEDDAQVWGIGESDFYSLPEDVRARLHWYERVNLNDPQAVAWALDRIKDATPHINAEDKLVIESHNEHWLNLEGHINELWKLEGPDKKLLNFWKRKSQMKLLFEEAGIKCARGILTSVSEQELASFIREVGFPFVLKPDAGVGACGVHKVENQEKLDELLLKINRQEYFLEEWVNAKMVTYDGMTNREGEVAFESSLIYSDGILEYVNRGEDPSFYTRREIPQKLRELGQKIVKLFQVKRKFFHFEFFKVGDDYWPVEVNCRPPGGPIMDMMNYSTDSDLYASYSKMLTEKSNTLNHPKKYFCGYVGRRYRRHYLHSHEDIVGRYGQNIVQAEENPVLFREAMGDFFYIFRSSTEAELVRMMEYMLRRN